MSIRSPLVSTTSLSGTFATFVNHGSDANVARPSGAGLVVWRGSVDPVNVDLTKDIVFKTGLTLFDTHTRTAGDVAVTSVQTTYQDIDNALDLTLDVSVGDVIAFDINAKWTSAATIGGRLNIRSVNRGAEIEAGTGGIPGWQGPPSEEQPIGATYFYTVVSGDISAGSATFRLRGYVSATGTRTLKAVTDSPLKFTGRVIA